MSVSTANPASRFAEAKSGSSEVVRAMVTGVDVKGQMFRHSATVLTLDGHDCSLRSKSQPEIDSSVLVEFDYPQADPKGRVSQAHVRSNHADLDGVSYTVVVELEVAQPVKVVANRTEPQTTAKAPSPASVPSVVPESKADPVTAYSESPLPPISKSVPQVVLLPNRENSVPVKVETRVPLPKTPAEDPVASREAAKLAVASEIKQQVQSLKIWISGEMEKSVPVVVSSIMEKMIADAVDKRISADRQTVTQGVNADVARQIEARIAESDDLRTALLGMATKLFEEQAELARATAAKAEQELISRVATAMQSFENPLAEMEARVNIARDAMERLGTRIAESNDQRAVLEDAVKRTFAEQVELSQAARAQAEEELNSRVTTTLQSFEKSLGEMEARVNVARIDMEQVGNRLAETDDLRMGLESAVNRIFEEQAELSRTTVSKIEQELTSRATMILHSFETSLAGMETRISSGRTEMESALARTHTLKQEIEDGMLPIQEGLERLNNAERVGIEQFQSQVEAQLRAAASLFENRLTEISAEKTVQMAMKLDAHLASHRQRADEAVDKLGAVLQLMQGTARVQKEKLTEHSLETAAKFEKEIREILLRLAGRA